MSHITLADNSHRAELTGLWAGAFGDGEAFISSFLEAYMIPGCNVPAVISGKEVVSALYLLDFPLYSNGKVFGECAYLFAAATKKEFRNRGHMSELIGYSAGLCRKRGKRAVFLFPQGGDPGLFGFYMKFGYMSVFAAKKITGAAGGAAPKPFRLTKQRINDPGVFGQVYKAYEKITAKLPLAPQKDRLFYLKCAASYLEDGETPGGRFAVLERINEHNSEKICYVFYKKYKNNYYIDDIIPIGDEKYGEIAEILADVLSEPENGANFEINVPPQSFSDAGNTPLAMILPLDEGTGDIIRGLEAPVYINMFMNV
jgi:GNAT superfamily N-acetyltransferase